MNLSNLEHAISYVRAGFSVIPLQFPIKGEGGLTCSCGNSNCHSPAKHPVGRLAPNGIKSSTRDEDTVESWFDSGTPWNIGIVTGQASGIIVLDIDPRHSGDKSLAAIEQKYGPIPPTCWFNTGGGGNHILFRHPGRLVPNSAGRIGEGIDVRGDGGYIVAPPSRHISGCRYSAPQGSIAEVAQVPDWLLAALVQTERLKQQPTSWQQISGPVPEGRRNDTLARLSGHLLGRGVDPHLCLDLLLDFNNLHCSPPLAPEEVAAIVVSIARREFTKRTAGHGRVSHD
jgi:hypothetical protein